MLPGTCIPHVLVFACIRRWRQRVWDRSIKHTDCSDAGSYDIEKCDTRWTTRPVTKQDYCAGTCVDNVSCAVDRRASLGWRMCSPS